MSARTTRSVQPPRTPRDRKGTDREHERPDPAELLDIRDINGPHAGPTRPAAASAAMTSAMTGRYHQKLRETLGSSDLT